MDISKAQRVALYEKAECKQDFIDGVLAARNPKYREFLKQEKLKAVKARAATTINSLYKIFQAKRDHKLLLTAKKEHASQVKAAILIQSLIRGSVARERFKQAFSVKIEQERQIKAATTLQKFRRGIKARRLYMPQLTPLKEERMRKKAAILLQRHTRALLARTRVKAQLHQAASAVIKIQYLFRKKLPQICKELQMSVTPSFCKHVTQSAVRTSTIHQSVRNIFFLLLQNELPFHPDFIAGLVNRNLQLLIHAKKDTLNEKSIQVVMEVDIKGSKAHFQEAADFVREKMKVYTGDQEEFDTDTATGTIRDLSILRETLRKNFGLVGVFHTAQQAIKVQRKRRGKKTYPATMRWCGAFKADCDRLQAHVVKIAKSTETSPLEADCHCINADKWLTFRDILYPHMQRDFFVEARREIAIEDLEEKGLFPFAINLIAKRLIKIKDIKAFIKEWTHSFARRGPKKGLFNLINRRLNSGVAYQISILHRVLANGNWATRENEARLHHIEDSLKEALKVGWISNWSRLDSLDQALRALSASDTIDLSTLIKKKNASRIEELLLEKVRGLPPAKQNGTVEVIRCTSAPNYNRVINDVTLANHPYIPCLGTMNNARRSFEEADRAIYNMIQALLTLERHM